MNTTLLFVEIFIAGLQGLVWVSLLIINLTGYQWLLQTKIASLGDWSFLISALLFSFSYSLGIVLDRTANTLFSAWEDKIRSKYITDENQSFAVMRYQLDNESINKQIEYSRTRLRIARSSALNFALITIFLVGLISKFDFLSLANKWKFGGITALIGVILSALFTASWYSLVNTNFNLILKVNKATAKQKTTTRKKDA